MMSIPDHNPNSPVPGGLTDTTYLVYVDDSGDETQDLLSALAIPVEVWADTLRKWKGFRRWVDRKFSIPPSVELHALDLGTNAKTGRGPLAELPVGSRNKIAKAAYSTLLGTPQLRVLTIYAPVPEGSGSLYSSLVEFIEQFCAFHDAHAIIWYDGTAESLAKVTRAAHRALPYSRRVLEDPHGYSSADSHLIQMIDFIAYAAHHAILNDLGVGPADTYLRQDAYRALLPHQDRPGMIWPGTLDGDGFPTFDHSLGIRGYPGPKAR